MTDSVVAATAGGAVAGRRGSAAIEFLGIPYAAAARFEPPRAPARWSGVRDAGRPGPAAPQPRRDVAEFTHGPLPGTAEDGSLNLNVFTPDLGGSRPVLVWLHGGGFAVGHAAASLYHGGRLAAEADVVVVTVNYRLGSLGWLAHPDLASPDGAPFGNWGLLDQIAALQWVRDNIAGFGGDPERVTLAGQSAGALAAADLLVAPGAEGLFQRAVLQSPPLGDAAQPLERAVDWAQALSAAAGGQGEFDPAWLRTLPADRIVSLHEQLLDDPRYRGTRGGALPTLDPATLPRSPVDEPGASPQVDVLIGSTAQEGSFFFASPWRPSPPPERIPSVVSHLTGEDPAAVMERYRQAGEPGRSDLDVLVDVATDAMVATPLARWAAARAAAGGRVWRFRVDHPGAGATLGATHTAEVPLLFGTWADGQAGERLGGQAPGADEVAHALVTAWAAFAHGQSPGWSGLHEESGAAPNGVFGGAGAFAVTRDAKAPLTKPLSAS